MDTYSLIKWGRNSETETHGYLGNLIMWRFAYPGEESPVLHNISFTAKPGETGCFLSVSTGSGKSTLVQVIPRFYDVTLGKSRSMSIDVRDYRLKSLRQKIGFILKSLALYRDYRRQSPLRKRGRQSWGGFAPSSWCSPSPRLYRKSKDFNASGWKGKQPIRWSEATFVRLLATVIKGPEYLHLYWDDSFSGADYRTDAILRKSS